jgi:hypothetical protein
MKPAPPLVISAAVEGTVDEAVLRRLVKEAGAKLGAVYGKSGKPALLRQLNAYNAAATPTPWAVILDLDRDAECAPPAKSAWLPRPSNMMAFTIAVREVEAWLLADPKHLAEFLRVPESRVPRQPEAEADPKRAMVNLARKSRRREIVQDMVPRAGSARPVGPAYTSRLVEFAERYWRPGTAQRRTASLRRCRKRLAALVRTAADAGGT